MCAEQIVIYVRGEIGLCTFLVWCRFCLIDNNLYEQLAGKKRERENVKIKIHISS